MGGGTSLPAQAAALEMLGLRGSDHHSPGAHASQLARVIAGVTLAGELSLMSALTTNDLLKSHLKLNRKPAAGEVAVAAGHISERMRSKLAEYASLAALDGYSAGNDHHHKQGSSNSNHASAHPVEASSSHSHSTTTHRAGSGAFGSSVHGGAPAGSHPHPLHMGGHSHGPAGSSAGPTGASSSPGRRYFAAGRNYLPPAAVDPLARAAHAALPGNAVNDMVVPWAVRGLSTLTSASPAVGFGVCEESRHGAPSHDDATEDHALPVP